ncbi:hypothetical protein AVEN_76337-1 [Araneus ventricosus]|uniref:PiggyBac transposable element-derived protein domain-containing protein n=1 Tax=Araneus ventricosus TaxID=182803 RepID=A0A4Y2S672_ARAVE|nr:hypothetical protein AVEN_76337-1 [Araneus ventricosus]
MMEDYSEAVSDVDEVVSEEEDHISIERSSSFDEEIETEGNLPDIMNSKDGKINHIQKGKRVYGKNWRGLNIVDLDAYIGILLLEGGVYKSSNESTARESLA